MGGTDCSRPLIHAKNKKILTDVFLVITDKETWKGKTPPYDALLQYRKVSAGISNLVDQGGSIGLQPCFFVTHTLRKSLRHTTACMKTEFCIWAVNYVTLF